MPPSREVLYKRLLNRDKNHEEIAMERMKQFDADVLHWKDYDLVVINDDLNKCFENIKKFIESTDYKKDIRQQNLMSKHVEKLLI